MGPGRPENVRRTIVTRASCLAVGAVMCWVMPVSAEAHCARVYFIVTGDTKNTEERKVTGWSNIRLSDTGQQQARAAGRSLPASFDAIYTSTLTRAMETAQLASGRFSMMTLPDLRPRNVGPFAGAHIDDGEFARRKSIPDDNLGGGETLSEYQARLQRAVMAMCADHPAGEVLLVVHQSTAADILAVLAGARAHQIRIPLPGEVAVVQALDDED